MQWEDLHRQARHVVLDLYGAKEPTAEDVAKLVDRLRSDRYDFAVDLVNIADWLAMNPRDLLAALDIQDFDSPVANMGKLAIIARVRSTLSSFGHSGTLPEILLKTELDLRPAITKWLIEAAVGLNRLRAQEIGTEVLRYLQ
ncbi:MAG TPA: hypothetical protein VEH48_00630 [Candidatus Nitrosopolaris sp.]|nr:hypothetical protein [Candidatus Nitrosopolaris sp.]